MYTVTLKILLAASLLFSWGGSIVVAAENEESSPSRTVKLKSVKVTANKMEENLKDVPQSITVIDEVAIEERGIKSIPDLVEYVPGMAITKDHGTAVNFRGLNASMFTSNNPVTLYIDGIGHSGRYGFDTSLVNVERVEVLRGPQATLYGKDAMGAVINVITKDPTNEWQGKIGTEYGSWNSFEGFGSMNGPLVEDTLFLGLSGKFDRKDGWITNDYPGMNDKANRDGKRQLNGYILLTSNDSWRVRLSGHHKYSKEYWYDEIGLAPGSTLEDFDKHWDRHVRYDSSTWTESEENNQSLQVAYSFNSMKLESITTHKHTEQQGEYDSDFSDIAQNRGLIMYDDIDENSWAQEFRVSSDTAKGFRWMCGVYADFSSKDTAPGWQFHTGAGNMEIKAISTAKSQSQAVFGQVMIPLGEQFELTLGGRYQRIHKDMDLDFYQFPVGGTAPPSYQLNTDKSWTAFLPKGALTYKISDTWTTYFSYSQGYMPGGFNNFPMGGSVADNTFEPEKSTNYEIGIKGSYEQLQLAAALFYMDIEDIHVFKNVGMQYMTDNAKKAHSQGVELEVTYLPIDSLELNGSVSVIRAKYDDYDSGTKKYDGEDIEQTPSYMVKFGAGYHAPCGFYARADMRHFGARSYFDSANAGFTKGDAYTVFDTKLGYRHKNWDFYGYVENITDEVYVDCFRSGGASAVVGVGDSRKFGAGIMYYF